MLKTTNSDYWKSNLPKIAANSRYWERHRNLLAAITMLIGVTACYLRGLIEIFFAWLIGEY